MATVEAVSISTETPEIFNLPEAAAPERKASRPSLHRRISNKRIIGRLPASPSLSPVILASEHTHETGVQPRDNDSESSRDLSHQQKKFDEGSMGRSIPLIARVKEWIAAERKKQKERKERRAAKRAQKLENGEVGTGTDRSLSPASSTEETELSLDTLEALLASAVNSQESLRHYPDSVRRRSSRKLRPRSLLGAGYASDTDYASDGEVIVPSCEARLSTVEEVGIDNFKKEVLTLTHTLRCKGWRRIDLDRYKEISVDRISGALTNAVYMVSPPEILPLPTTVEHPSTDEVLVKVPKTPVKLLLRIYGPQVSHLIDRETELSILRRLARKHIGPRLMGTFENGRFEQFFTARTLTKDDIRIPETSRHIAKRLKELHEGIELEDEERKKGAIAWSNWEKWVPRARKVMNIVDGELVRKFGEMGVAGDGIVDERARGWENRGFVCGAKWEVFEGAVEKYRKWLYEKCGGEEALKEELVFAHNDAQYGNILRLQATGKSPLLLPSNEHRQLIVIDFEYANANAPGFEFANHFCEWMANYHDPSKPHVLHPSKFPSRDEQRNFLRAYVEHHLSSTLPARIPSAVGTPDNTPSPALRPSSTNRTSIPLFYLDSRTPTGSYREEEAARQREVEKETERLMEEAKVWRAASHAMWCVWGIVQAKVKGKEDEVRRILGGGPSNENVAKEDVAVEKVHVNRTQKEEEEEEGEEEEEFDYLGYAQQRALLFWGDMVELGVLTMEEVRALGVGARAKRVVE